jgi:hypothetical protein
MRRGNKGLLIRIDPVPDKKESRPFTIAMKKYWPAGKPSAEW